MTKKNDYLAERASFFMISLVLIISIFSTTTIAASSATIFLPDTFEQGKDTIASLILSTEAKTQGIVFISYENIESTTTSRAFDNASFSGPGPYQADFTWTIKGINPGTYKVKVNVTDAFLITIASAEKIGIVSSSMPQIVSSSPSGSITSNEALLSVETNEDATCKYDINDMIYNQMQFNFSITGMSIHKESLTAVTEGNHKYFVRCKDSFGYMMNSSTIIDFTFDRPPTAKIQLSKDPPISKGTIEVTVYTSEPVMDTPTFSYALDDAPAAMQPISLSGRDSQWKGYLIISGDDNNKVGTFYFSGIDKSGSTGTLITDGKLFIVDTIKPTGIKSIKAEILEGGEIDLEWYYDGEETEKFNIYRSTSQGVTEVDYYDSKNGTGYEDQSTYNHVTYYYRVAAVDKAGNVGPLSQEVFGTSVAGINTTQNTQETSELPKILPPDIHYIVDDEVKVIDSLILDVDSILEDFSKEEDSQLKAVYSEFNYAQTITTAKTSLSSMREEVENYKRDYMTKEELNSKINGKKMDIKKIEQTMPKKVEILEKTEFIQGISPGYISEAINVALSDVFKDEASKKKAVSSNTKINEDIKVEVNAYLVEITYLDDASNEFALIEKKITYENPDTLNDVFIIEEIPKSVAETTDEITFLSGDYTIIKKDPLIRWSAFELNYQGVKLKYKINKRISLADLKNSKTVAITNMNQVEDTKTGITGFSIMNLFTEKMGFSQLSSLMIWIGLFMILALYLYYQFFVKKDNPSRKLVHSARYEDYDARNQQYQQAPQYAAPQHIPVQSIETPPRYSSEYTPIQKTPLANVQRLPVQETKTSQLQNTAYHSSLQKIDNNLPSQSHLYADQISAMIGEANYHLKKNRVQDALALYIKIEQTYQALPQNLKKEVYPKCAELHFKINSFGRRAY